MSKIDDNDIKNLNTEMVYTPEQKAKIQKQFFLLFLFFVIVIIIMLFYFIFREDIKSKFENKKEEVEVEVPEEESLYKRENGDISTDDPKIIEMFNIFYFDVNEYFLFDSSNIYKTSFSNLPDSEKLFFISKTSDFDRLINEENNYLTKEKLCSNQIIIDKEEIEKIGLNRFNLNEMNHTDFWTVYSYDNVFLSFISFKYTNNKYIGTCSDYNKKNVNILASNIISRAEKKEEYIYIYIKTIFETKSGVYGDVNLNNKITSIYNKEDLLDYYENGSNYKLEFKYNGKNDYYFEKMSLIEK